MANRNFQVASAMTQRGVSMIEVMVALVVLLLGLLPLSGLLARTHRAELESYERKQVVILLQGMVDRLNANHNAASCYAITTNTSTGSPYVGDGSTVDTSALCAVGVGIPIIPSAGDASRANSDFQDWDVSLKGNAEMSGTTSIGGALKARGCVTNDGVVGGDAKITQYTVSVAWQGTTPLPLPTSASTCGKGSYDTADTLRRVMGMVVRVPSLN